MLDLGKATAEQIDALKARIDAELKRLRALSPTERAELDRTLKAAHASQANVALLDGCTGRRK
jgi:uncharacterized protein involved in exopolysaccharide biosynthesis